MLKNKFYWISGALCLIYLLFLVSFLCRLSVILSFFSSDIKFILMGIGLSYEAAADIIKVLIAAHFVFVILGVIFSFFRRIFAAVVCYCPAAFLFPPFSSVFIFILILLFLGYKRELRKTM